LVISPSKLNIQGFTLIEVLLVVVIIAIMSVVSVNVINSQSYERQVMSHAAEIEAELKYLCDKAVLENRAYGIEWTKESHNVLKYQLGDWVVQQSPMNQREQKPQFQIQVLLNGLTQNLPQEAEELPHVICQSDGTMNPFELRWLSLEPNGAYYSLKAETPWQVKGAWVEK
jgi:general secretion pathway protein H